MPSLTPETEAIEIREERPGEAGAVRDLVARAFAPMAFADGDEDELPEKLREGGDLIVALVATRDGRIIGQATFSASAVGDDPGWAALGPIAVEPDCQRCGIGSEMVAEGLARLRALGLKGCVLTGNPKVYGPMGFDSGRATYGDTPAHIVQHIAFGNQSPDGEILFAPAFRRNGAPKP